MASASDHRAHAALQPADCLILLPQRLPAAVETSIGPAHYPAECTQSDAFLQPSLRARNGRANSNSLGMCRSGRIGGASGSVTVGNGRSRERRGEMWSRGGDGASFGDQKAVGGNTESGMVVEAAPPAPFIITKPELLLQLLIIALDPPSQLCDINQTFEGDILWQS